MGWSRAVKHLCAGLVLAFAAGCPSPEPTPEGGCPGVVELTGPSATQRVDERGCEIHFRSSADSTPWLALRVPEGALIEETSLTLTAGSGPFAPEVVPDSVFDLGPTAVTLAAPVTLALHYDPAKLGGIAEPSLALGTFVDGDWKTLDSTLDAEGDVLTVTTTRLGRWGAVEGDEAGPALVASTPPSGSVIKPSASIVLQFDERLATGSAVVGGNAGAEAAAPSFSQTARQNDTVTLSPAAAWAEGAERTLTVQVADFSDNEGAPVQLTFEVDGTPATATAAPATGSVIGPGTSVEVTFDDVMLPASLSVGGSLAASAGAGSWSGGDKVLTLAPTSAWPGGAQTLELAVEDDGRNESSVSLSFTVDATGPVASVAPASGSTLGASDVITVTFDEPIDTASLTLTGTMTGAGQVTASSGASWNGAGTVLTLTPETAWTEGAGRTLELTATDLVGNALATAAFTFTVDATGPVASVAPASGSTLGASDVITVTFDEPIDTASLTLTGTMTGAGQVTASSGASWNGAGTVLTLTPETAWTGGTGRTLELAATDLVGNALAAAAYTFDVDATGPTVISAVPAIGVPLELTQPLIVTFDEPAVPGSLTLTGTMTGAGQVSDTSGVSWDGTATVLTLTPETSWTLGAGRTLTIAVTDALGNAGGGALTYEVLPPDTQAPVVSIDNLHDKGLVRSSLLVGTVTDDWPSPVVEVSLDGAAYQPATAGSGNSWSFRLPTGAASWRQHSQHVIEVRATDAAGHSSSQSISVRKAQLADLNGDGYADLALGSQGAATVRVFHGGPAGIAATDKSQASSTITNGSGAFGCSVATGDVNGDGYADLVVGGYQAGAGGRVWVFHGSPSGVPSGAASTVQSLALDSPTSGAYFGMSHDLGDINGDGFDDLAVGGYRETIGSFSFAGRFQVYNSLGAAGLSATPAADVPGTTFNGMLGRSVTVADLNGDRYADVIVAADGINQVYVYLSAGAAGVTATSLSSASSVISGESGGGAFGHLSASGDVNGDDYEDLVVSAMVISAGGLSQAGRVYVFHGSSAGVAATSAGSADRILSGHTASIRLGNSIAVGDLDGDGFGDVLVGAPYYTSNQGQALSFHGSASGVGATASATLNGGSGVTYFGMSAAISDYDGDGYGDAVIGTIWDGPGRMWLLPGSSSGLASSTLGPTDARFTGATGESLGVVANNSP